MNRRACETWLPVFRCPSNTAPGQLNVNGIPKRVPSNYLASVSGLIRRESGECPCAGDLDVDGFFQPIQGRPFAHVLDGLSHTIAVGEAQFRFAPARRGSPGCAAIHRPLVYRHSRRRDERVFRGGWQHWRAPNHFPNAVGVAFVDELELSFGSHHPSIVQVVFVDGHVESIMETIDQKVWNAMGTRAHGEP